MKKYIVFSDLQQLQVIKCRVYGLELKKIYKNLYIIPLNLFFTLFIEFPHENLAFQVFPIMTE